MKSGEVCYDYAERVFTRNACRCLGKLLYNSDLQMKTTLDTMLKTCRRTSLAIERFKTKTAMHYDVANFLQQIQTTLTGLQHQIESLQEEIEK